MASIDTTANNFLGQGMIFPITLNSSGRPNIVGGGTLIEASIRDILSWASGTRFMLGEYGSSLEKLLEEPNDNILQSLVRHFTVEVISKWESRVEILDVLLDSKKDNILNISISYQIKNTKITGSFIYPYYSQLIY